MRLFCCWLAWCLFVLSFVTENVPVVSIHKAENVWTRTVSFAVVAMFPYLLFSFLNRVEEWVVCPFQEHCKQLPFFQCSRVQLVCFWTQTRCFNTGNVAYVMHGWVFCILVFSCCFHSFCKLPPACWHSLFSNFLSCLQIFVFVGIFLLFLWSNPIHVITPFLLCFFWALLLRWCLCSFLQKWSNCLQLGRKFAGFLFVIIPYLFVNVEWCFNLR